MTLLTAHHSTQGFKWPCCRVQLWYLFSCRPVWPLSSFCAGLGNDVTPHSTFSVCPRRNGNSVPADLKVSLVHKSRTALLNSVYRTCEQMPVLVWKALWYIFVFNTYEINWTYIKQSFLVNELSQHIFYLLWCVMWTIFCFFPLALEKKNPSVLGLVSWWST